MSCLFPNFKVDTGNMDLIEETWLAVLSPYTAQEISIALNTIVSEGVTFAPSVGEIIAKIKSIGEKIHGEELTEMQAWVLVRKALSNSVYNSKAEFDKLPPKVKEAVGDPFNLQEWAKNDFETVDTVIQSNFLRSYRRVEMSHKEINALPDSVRNRVTANNSNGYLERTENNSMNKIDLIVRTNFFSSSSFEVKFWKL